MRDVRLVDYLFTAVLVGLAATLGVMNVTAADWEGVESHSWLQLPLLVATALPLLWWRRAPVLAVGAATALMAAHDLLFGYGVRCGSGLPLAFAFAFLIGLGSDRRKGLAGAATGEALRSRCHNPTHHAATPISAVTGRICNPAAESCTRTSACTARAPTSPTHACHPGASRPTP